MKTYEYPKTTPLDENGNWTPAWAQWIQRTHNNARTLQQSGPTAERPDQLLWLGRFYFDTTINKPVWLRSINPSVWVDGAGVVS
jgi:hypothetical protein